MRRRRSGGFSVPEQLFGIIVASIVVVVATLAVGFALRANASAGATQNGIRDVENFGDQAEVSANSAIGMYTPPSCGGDQYGDGGSCSSLRFIGKDSSGTYHFWGYDYDSTTQTLTPCVAYTTAYGACPTGKTGRVVENVGVFSATPMLVTNLTVPFINGDGAYANHNYEIAGSTYDPDCTGDFSSDSCRLIAGNRLMVVEIGNSYSTRELDLLQGGAPFSTSLITGMYQPPQVGSGIQTSSGIDPQPLWFWDTSTAENGSSIGPQSIAVSPCTSDGECATETNYSTYESDGQAVSPWWTASYTTGGCVVAGPSYTPTSASDSVAFAVSPGTSLGGCTFAIATQDQSATVQAYTAGPLTAGTVSGTTFTPATSVTIPWNGSSWGSVEIGGGKTWDADEDDYTGQECVPNCTSGPSGTGAPDLDQVQFSGCGSNVWIGPATTIVADGSTPTAAYGFADVVLQGTGPGTCTLTIRNPVTNESTSMQVTVQTKPEDPCEGGPTSFTTEVTQGCTITVPGGSGSCDDTDPGDGDYGEDVSSGGTLTFTPGAGVLGSMSPSGTTFTGSSYTLTFTPTAPGTETISDSYEDVKSQQVHFPCFGGYDCDTCPNNDCSATTCVVEADADSPETVTIVISGTPAPTPPPTVAPSPSPTPTASPTPFSEWTSVEDYVTATCGSGSSGWETPVTTLTTVGTMIANGGPASTSPAVTYAFANGTYEASGAPASYPQYGNTYTYAELEGMPSSTPVEWTTYVYESYHDVIPKGGCD